MNLLFRVLYAVHARGSHHKLALDALRHLSGPHAEGWQRLFLQHAEQYMEGAKAPDDTFKDFCNHVLHVRDGYWGGAPGQVEKWYGDTVAALKASDWSDAVYSAGVLSHYYVDPIHPFHTAQSDAENNIHRAVEWSINRSYDELCRQSLALPMPRLPSPEPGGSWLREFVCAGAETSNRYYETLIAHYDFNIGVVNPPAGLDPVARKAVAELIGYAQLTFAHILDRAFAEAAVSPPQVNLTVDTALAVLKVPLKFVLKKLEDAADRRLVEAMYDELATTGRVEKNLSEDDRAVRDAHALDILVPRSNRLEQKRQAVVAGTSARKPEGAPAPKAVEPKPAPEATPLRLVAPEPTPAPAAPIEQIASAVLPVTSSVPLIPRLSHLTETTAPRQLFRLAGGDDVERAPSIGPRMAERLAGIGIKTVDDLLAAEPETISIELALRHVTTEIVQDWQDQSRLVMQIPDLRGGQAQLLVGAGYRSRAQVAAADPVQLSANVLAFASTPEGRRILREGNPPDIEAIKAICERAQRQAA